MDMKAAVVRADERGAERAYEAIAPVYDDFTAHHDYELWLGNMLPELRRHGLRGSRLLDVACGTGKSFLPMLGRGWDVVACDVSPAMVEVARAKVGDAAELSVADMRDLPVFGEFDLVWTLDDPINYLLDEDEVAATLRGMKANLAPGGLLVFDANTLLTFRSFFAEVQQVERDGKRLTWRGLGSTEAAPSSTSEARFEIEAGPGDVETHVHRQRHFPEAVILELLSDAGLECLDVFGHGFDTIFKQPVEELVHSKAIYISRAS